MDKKESCRRGRGQIQLETAFYFCLRGGERTSINLITHSRRRPAILFPESWQPRAATAGVGPISLGMATVAVASRRMPQPCDGGCRCFRRESSAGCLAAAELPRLEGMGAVVLAYLRGLCRLAARSSSCAAQEEPPGETAGHETPLLS